MNRPTCKTCRWSLPWSDYEVLCAWPISRLGNLPDSITESYLIERLENDRALMVSRAVRDCPCYEEAPK